MKKVFTSIIYTALIIVIPIVGADNHIQSDLAQIINTTRHNDAVAVETLIQRSLILRQKIPPFVEQANLATQSHKGAIPSALSAKIAFSIAEANTIRTTLFPYALRYRNTLYRTDESFDDRDRIESILISMSAALALYDNAHVMQQQFDTNSALREKLNEAYPEYAVNGNFYKDSLLRASTMTYRSSMLDAIHFFDDNQEKISLHIAKADPTIRSLYEYISNSPMRSNLGGDNTFIQISNQVTTLLSRAVELPLISVEKLKFNLSKVIGNTMGAVRWRSGKLRDDVNFLNEFSQHLQPGDILLEKTPFALTDKTIPGHFGHAAIYIGTYEQLRDIGALETPFVRKHIEQIREGKVILEALREGVVLNSIEHFMNIDDVAVLRPSKLEPQTLRSSLDLAMSHYGKKYDFDFNVNTTETIVCSELVYAAYPHIDFMTKKVLSSFTISPDDIAVLASGDKNAPLELTFFAHDGKKVYIKGEKEEGLELYVTLVGLKKQHN